MKLRLKQQRFALEYVGAAQGNGTEACRRAGYQGSDDTLAGIASENLKKPAIIDAIKALERDGEDDAIATRKELRELWTRIAFGGETETIVTREGAVVEVVAPLAARLKASELLGKSKGLFVDRVENTGANGGPMQIEHDGGRLIVMTPEDAAGIARMNPPGVMTLAQVEALLAAREQRPAARTRTEDGDDE